MTTETVFERMVRLAEAERLNSNMIALFSEVFGGVAIIRQSPGILKQVPVFARREQVFIKAGGGFIRVIERLGPTEPYLTVHPNFSVLELDGEGISLEGNKAPRYKLKV